MKRLVNRLTYSMHNHKNIGCPYYEDMNNLNSLYNSNTAEGSVFHLYRE